VVSEGAIFAGKVAIVTGASRGIGLDIARRLVDLDCRVCITARKQDGLDDALVALGGETHAFTVAGRADDVEHQQIAVESVISRFDRLDLLVNNAGINPFFGDLMDLDLSVARKIFEVNCLSALSWSQFAYKKWMKANGGSIINISSVTGMRPSRGIGFYGASKAMLSFLTQQMAWELGPRVRVNAVAPGVVKTDFAAPLYEGQEDALSATYPMQRLGLVSDVSHAVSFLASDDAAWITGQTLNVDGGLLLNGGV
jgi:NAD(P)-dependent dehydrogenase (short-subunit alcohol dehydrogenase family)